MSETVTLRKGITDLLQYKANNSTSDISGTINLNNLTTEGKYYIQDSSTVSNLPVYSPSGAYFIEVFDNAVTPTKTLCQRITSVTDGLANIRYSTDGGTTWGAWKYVEGIPKNTSPFYICIDLTNGNDANDGLSQNAPIKTMAEFYRRLATANGPVTIYLGPGSYGDLEFTPSFPATNYHIGPLYDNQTQPEIGKLSFIDTSAHIEDLNCDLLVAQQGALVTTGLPCTFGLIYITKASSFGMTQGASIKALTQEQLTAYAWNTSQGVIFEEDATDMYLDGTITFLQENLLSTIISAHAGRISVGDSFAYSGTFTTATTTTYGYQFTNLPKLLPDMTISSNWSKFLALAGTSAGISTLYGAYTSGTSIKDLGYASITAALQFRKYGMTKGQIPTANTSLPVILFTDSYASTAPQAAHSFAMIQPTVHSSGTTTSLALWALSNVENGSSGTTFKIYSSGYMQGPSYYPTTTDKYTLGHSTLLWKEIYCSNATINTSDARLKSNASVIPDEVLDAWEDVRLKVFQMNEALEEKGLQARWHSGVIAQEVQKAFMDHGVDPTRYAFFCHDTWEASDNDDVITLEPEERDEFGNVTKSEVTEVIHHHQDAGDRYSIRYNEFLVIEAAYLRRENERLKTRVTSLETEVAELKTLVQRLISNQ